MRRLGYIAGARRALGSSPQGQRASAESWRKSFLREHLRPFSVAAVDRQSLLMLLRNRLPRVLCVLLLFSGIAVPPSSVARAHKFYASLAQADLNAETNSLEISLRLFSDDLELALTRRMGRAIYLDQPEVSAPLVLAYLREKFELKNAAGQSKELTWVGMEPRVDATWIYFEIRDVGDLTGATLRNRIFFEQFDEQTNTVNIRRGDRHTALVFRQGDDFKIIFNE